MPIRAIERLYDAATPSNEIGIRLVGVGANGSLQVLYADIPGNSWNQNRLNNFMQAAQNKIDQRILRTSLPADDPARLANPARPDFFWDGSDIVSRSITVSDVSWTGARLNFKLTRAF